MTTSRIDHLRTLVASIGARQLEYHRFFPAFADRLENELGNYLGSKESVALCCAYEDFTFDQGSYRHTGLGFEAGRYRIPFMFRLKNLEDNGDFLARVRLYFTREDAKLSVQIDGEGKLEVDENDTAPLTEYIYRHLCNVLTKSNWLEQNKADYQSTAMGFTSAA